MATRWQPDTCGCVIEYDNDLVAISAKPCPLHVGADHHEVFAKTLAHNRHKNEVHNYLRKQYPEDVLAGVFYDADMATLVLAVRHPHAHRGPEIEGVANTQFAGHPFKHWVIPPPTPEEMGDA